MSTFVRIRMPGSDGWDFLAAAMIMACMVTASLAAGACSRPMGDATESLEATSRPRMVKVAQGTLWLTARKSPRPVYPPESLHEGVGGVAVASLVIGTDGRVESMTVLQAPDQDTEFAVRDALERWEFTPVQVGESVEPSRSQGKLTFYFVPEGSGRVLSPEEMVAFRSASTSTDADTYDRVPAEIGGEELQRLMSADDVVVVDVGPRSAFQGAHAEGAVNLPYDELRRRAVLELSSSRYVVLDCAHVRMSTCQNSARALRNLGFARVSVYDPSR